MNYTKGEWKVKPPDYENERGIVIYNDIDNGIVARVATLGGTKNEVETNAHLISAAPDMYEALKETRITLNILQPRGSALLREIDKALNKAEGK